MLMVVSELLIKLLGGGVSGSEQWEVRGKRSQTAGGFMHSDFLLRCEDAFSRSKEGFWQQLATCRSPRPWFIYSHFHHRVHVLYYLWSHTGTAQCLSPTSYQQFVPVRFICGGKKRNYYPGGSNSSHAVNEDHSCSREWDLTRRVGLLRTGNVFLTSAGHDQNCRRSLSYSRHPLWGHVRLFPCMLLRDKQWLQLCFTYSACKKK